MRIRTKKKPPQDKTQWHVWFAWHPVTITNRDGTFKAWLEFVERRGEFVEDSLGGDWSYQYRDATWYP